MLRARSARCPTRYILDQGVKSCTGPRSVILAWSCRAGFTEELARHRSRGDDRVHQVGEVLAVLEPRRLLRHKDGAGRPVLDI